jgi:hypothetical protein
VQFLPKLFLSAFFFPRNAAKAAKPKDRSRRAEIIHQNLKA